MSVMIDTPEGIDYVRFIMVVQGLSMELRTGMRLTRGGSVLKVAQREGYTSVRGNATKKNLCLALAQMIHDRPDSPVINRARVDLQKALAENGWQIEMA